MMHSSKTQDKLHSKQWCFQNNNQSKNLGNYLYTFYHMYAQKHILNLVVVGNDRKQN